jgi:leader peptidase (prepilin peptidase)/N-methyltransferase
MELILQLVPIAYLLAVAIPLITTDISERRLPNKLVLPSIPITLVCWIALAVIYGLWQPLFVALACALLVGVLGFVAVVVGGIGMGDVKLTFALVLVVSWFSWWLGLLIPVLGVGIGLLVASYEVFVRKQLRSSSIPIGPFLIGASAFALGLAVM